MGAFLKHPKFWLPILVLLAIEGVFRLGIWEPVARPDSFAGTSVALILATEEFGPERVGRVTLGDSRSLMGFDHRRLLADSLDQERPAHLGLSLPGSHLATLKVESRWAIGTFPTLETMVVGLAPSILNRTRNGYYEIGVVEPFRQLGDGLSLVSHFPPQTGNPRSLGALSAFMAYRDDVFQAIRQPRLRFAAVSAARRRPADDRLGFQTKRTNDLCEFDLSSFEACQRELRSLQAGGQGGEPVARSLARNCQAPNQIDGAVRERARVAWLEWIASTGSQTELVIVLMPEHSLLSQPEDLTIAREMLNDLHQSGSIRLLDLFDAFTTGDQPQCAYYTDLLHANSLGMTLLTDRLVEILGE
jgi:hypothetical protein